MALNPDSSQTIDPYLRFGGTNPLQGYVANQHQNDNFVKKNALNAEKFNEFERLFYNLCAYVGDVASQFEGRTVGTQLRYIETKIDDITAVQGEGRPVGAFHLWLKGGNIFQERLSTDGDNVTETRANGVHVSFSGMNATFSPGVAIIGNTKSNNVLLEVKVNKTITLDPIGTNIIGTNLGVALVPTDTGPGNWTNGELHTTGVSDTEVQLHYGYIKSSYFTGVSNYTVVAVVDPTGAKTVKAEGTHYTVDENTGIVTILDAGMKGVTIAFYYVHYTYRKDWIYLKNTGTETDKVFIRKGNSYDSLGECLNGTTYYNPDTLTYETLPSDPTAELLIYEIIQYPWNTLIDTFYKTQPLTRENNVLDLRSNNNTSVDINKNRPNGVLGNPIEDWVVNASSITAAIDFQTWRADNPTFNTFLGYTEDIVDLSDTYFGGSTAIIYSNAKPFKANQDYEITFYAYTDDLSDSEVEVAIYNDTTANELFAKSITINNAGSNILKYRVYIPSISDEDWNEAKIRITGTTQSAGTHVYMADMKMVQLDAGLDVITIDSTTTAACLPHLCMIDGHPVATKYAGFTISQTMKYAAIVSDINGDLSLRYASESTSEFPRLQKHEAYVQFLFIDADKTIFSMAAIDYDIEILVAKTPGMFINGLALQHMGFVKQLIVEGGTDLSSLGDISLPTNSSVVFRVGHSGDTVKVAGTITILDKTYVKCENCFIEYAHADGDIYIGHASTDQSGIEVDVKITSSVASQNYLVKAENIVGSKIRITSEDSEVENGVRPFQFAGQCNSIDIIAKDLSAGSNTIYSGIDIRTLSSSRVNANMDISTDGTIITYGVEGDTNSDNNIVLANITPNALVTKISNGFTDEYSIKNTLLVNARIECDLLNVTSMRPDSNVSRYIQTVPASGGLGGELILGDDSPDGDVKVIIAGSLEVQGTETSINTQNIEIGVNKILLNSGVVDNSDNRNASYEVKRVDDELQLDRTVANFIASGTIIMEGEDHGIVVGDYFQIVSGTTVDNDGAYKATDIVGATITVDETYKQVDTTEVGGSATLAKHVNAKLLWDDDNKMWKAGRINEDTGVFDYAWLTKDVIQNGEPTVNDDSSLGYNPFSMWMDEDDDYRLYICRTNGTGTAKWEVAGGGVKAKDITSNYVIGSESYNMFSCTGAGISLSIGNPANSKDRIYYIFNEDTTNSVSITSVGTGYNLNNNGALTITLPPEGSTMALICDGDEWFATYVNTRAGGHTYAGPMGYNGSTKSAGLFYGGVTEPDTTAAAQRLNYDGPLIATEVHVQNSTSGKMVYSAALPFNGSGIDMGVGEFKAAKIHNAVWNDIVDWQEMAGGMLEYGKCYYDTTIGAKMCTKRCQKSTIGIASDTFGFGVGHDDDQNQVPIAIGGWTLAHVTKKYAPGTALVSDWNGTLTKARLYEKMFFPERIVAIYKRPEDKKLWGPKGKEIEVKGRHWVKVK